MLDRRPVLPRGVAARLVQLEPNPIVRDRCRDIAALMDGRDVATFRHAGGFAMVRDQLAIEDTALMHAMAVLQQAGYGEQPVARAQSSRPAAARRKRRKDARARSLRGFIGKLPRAAALRIPTTANTHLTGPRDGTDIWGPVRCNMTLHDGHLGAIAAGGGMWVRDADAAAGEDFGELETAELAVLLRTADRRNHSAVSGSDVAWVLSLAYDLWKLRCSATVNRPDASDAHELPSNPVRDVTVQRADGRFVGIDVFMRLIATGEEHARSRTRIRFHLAEWARRELAHRERRPTYIDFGVWRCLGGTSRRLYAFLQGRTRSRQSGRVELYLAAPGRFTFGLTSRRMDRSRAIIRHALNEIRVTDERYDGWGETPRPGTNLTLFLVKAVAGAASSVRTGRRGKRAPCRRPAVVRKRVLGVDQVRVYDELSPSARLIVAMRVRETLRRELEQADRQRPPRPRGDRSGPGPAP